MIQDIAKQSINDIEHLQFQKLKQVLNYVSNNSPYYKSLFNAHHITVSDINSIDDLNSIPTTNKDDLQLHNDDFLCVPKSKIIDYVTTSGTLGAPVTIALTENDLNRLTKNEAMSFECAGITKDDTLQLMTTVDRRFMAGLAYVMGARKLGAGMIRVGAGIPELQWDSILKFEPTYLIAVPSFLLKLIEYANSHNIVLNDSSVKGAICIGEPIRDDNFILNALGQKITDAWDINLYSTYASTEMQTAFTECKQQQGGHLHPELIITEILDENNNPVPHGQVGELTITTIDVEAMPLIRFKTGDMLRAHDEPCNCGRNTLRLGPVTGRKKQMIKYKGTTLFPPAMENILNHFKTVEGYVIEISKNDIGTDEILIKIASSDPSHRQLQDIKDHFRAKLRVTPRIEFHDKAHINTLKFPKMSRKPVLVIDKRNND